MLPFQQVFDKVYDAHLSGKTAFFNVRIGDYMCKLLLAPGASPQTPPGGLFLPAGPPPPAWVDASHGHGLGHQINSIQLLVPEPSLRPSSGSRGRLWNGLHDVTMGPLVPNMHPAVKGFKVICDRHKSILCHNKQTNKEKFKVWLHQGS